MGLMPIVCVYGNITTAKSLIAYGLCSILTSPISKVWKSFKQNTPYIWPSKSAYFTCFNFTGICHILACWSLPMEDCNRLTHTVRRRQVCQTMALKTGVFWGSMLKSHSTSLSVPPQSKTSVLCNIVAFWVKHRASWPAITQALP